MRRLLAAAAITTALAMEAPAQTGEAFEFDETGRQIVVDRETHWRNWVYQNNLVRDVRAPMDSTGLFDFSEGVKPRYFPAVRNYVLDREEFSFVDNVRFRGQTVTVTGQITALSNDALAGRVGDGDLTTFWEPSSADFNAEGLRNWQLLVDLGRVVFADSIVVHFPPAGTGEDLGDAPKLFTVEVSMGIQAGDREYHFDVVGRQSVSGSQRRFVFPLRPLDQADADLDGEPDFEGTFVHFVRLAIFDSDLDAAELIGEGGKRARGLRGAGTRAAGHAHLPAADRGGFRQAHRSPSRGRRGHPCRPPKRPTSPFPIRNGARSSTSSGSCRGYRRSRSSAADPTSRTGPSAAPGPRTRTAARAPPSTPSTGST